MTSRLFSKVPRRRPWPSSKPARSDPRANGAGYEEAGGAPHPRAGQGAHRRPVGGDRTAASRRADLFRVRSGLSARSSVALSLQAAAAAGPPRAPRLRLRSDLRSLRRLLAGWMGIKLHSRDSPDAGPGELAYSLMARDAGITMPPARLFETRQGERFFGVERFDRQGNHRYHVHTFGNLIQANFRIPSCDYRQLLEVTRILKKNHQDVLECYLRMVFNVLTHT